MDEQTRRDVDEACLRLLGFDPQWDADYGDWAVMIGGTRRHRRPSTDPALVVPLAEALIDFAVVIERPYGTWWRVTLTRATDTEYWAVMHTADSLPEALAVSAAQAAEEALAKAAVRAVGTETKE